MSTLLKYQNQLDVYNETFNKWMIGTVVRNKDEETTVEIMYFGFDRNQNEVISKDASRRFAKLHSHTFPITQGLAKQQAPIMPYIKKQPNPFVYDKNYILIATGNGVLQFNMISERFSKRSGITYDYFGIDFNNGYITNLILDQYAVDGFMYTRAIDSKDTDYHLSHAGFTGIGTACDSCNVIVINHKSTDNVKLFYSDPMHHSRNVVHVFNGSSHLYHFQDPDSSMDKLSKDKFKLLHQHPSDGIPLVVTVCHKLLFLCSNKFIYECDLNGQTKCQWKKTDIKLPEWYTIYCKVIIIFDSLVAIFSIETMNITFMDYCGDRTWYSYDNKLALTLSDHTNIVDGENGFLYCIKHHNEAVTYKLWWRDILPNKLCEQYIEHRRFEILVHGFVREVENKHKLYYNVPLYLKAMIYKFYPVWM